MTRVLFALVLCCWAFTPLSAQKIHNAQARRLFAEGTQALRLHQGALAQTKLQAALKLEPNHPQIHWELGWAYWQKQDWNKVIQEWKKTQKLNPKQADLNKYLRLATEYAQLEQAEGSWEIVVEDSPSGKGEITLIALGDLMMGSDLKGPEKLPPFAGEQLFSPLEGLLQGDLVFANLEGPLTKAQKTDKCKANQKCFAFRTPPRYARHLKKAGINIVNLANNHILDFGLPGLKETIGTLKDYGIASFGTLAQPSLQIQIKGMKLGFIGVAAVSCCIHLDEIETMAHKVRALKQENHLVIVSMHAGAEGLNAAHVPLEKEFYFGESRGDTRAFSHAMIDAGADLVLGHGPHSLRGMEFYQGKLVVYSLGNFMGYLGFSTSGHLSYGMILKLKLTQAGKITALQVIPLKMRSAATPQPDPKGRAIRILNRLSREDFGPQGVQLSPQGIWRQKKK